MVRRENKYFLENSEYVAKQQVDGDYSVANSYYMTMGRDSFRGQMILDQSAADLLPPVNMNNMDRYICNVFPAQEVMSRSYPLLEEPLDSSRTSFKSLILSGLLDTMYTSFKESLPEFEVRFSLTMLETAVHSNATVIEVAEYLKREGVCSEEDYEKEIARGTQDKPLCYRVGEGRMS